jgi:hypothetical protein
LTPLFNQEGTPTLATGCSQGNVPARAEGLTAQGAGVMPADATVFLPSKASPLVNGHMLYVDGGVTTSL